MGSDQREGWRFRFTLRTAVIIFVLVSGLLGLAILGWPYACAWYDMEKYVRGNPKAGSSALIEHFAEQGKAGYWALKRALSDPDPELRKAVIEAARGNGLADPLIPAMAYVSLYDSDPQVRDDASDSISYIWRYSSFLPELDKLKQPSMEEIEALAQKVKVEESR